MKVKVGDGHATIQNVGRIVCMHIAFAFMLLHICHAIITSFACMHAASWSYAFWHCHPYILHENAYYCIIIVIISALSACCCAYHLIPIRLLALCHLYIILLLKFKLNVIGQKEARVL